MTKLTETESKILEYLRDHPDTNKNKIASALGLSYSTVWNAFKKSEFCSDLISDIKSDKTEFIVLAVNALRDILEKASPQVRLNAALSVLKDAGIISDKQSSPIQSVVVKWENETKEPEIRKLDTSNENISNTGLDA